MENLTVTTNLSDPDRCYTAIIDAHRGLSEEDSSELNARLVLILANHIGDKNVLDEAIVLARTDLAPVTLPPDS
ncbi:MAG: DUF2783 domain-containing protein [Hyphomicrobiales bacterium]